MTLDLCKNKNFKLNIRDFPSVNIVLIYYTISIIYIKIISLIIQVMGTNQA